MTEPGYLGGALSNHQIKKQFFQTTWLDVPLYYSLLFSAILLFSTILFYSIILYSTLLFHSTLSFSTLLFSAFLYPTLYSSLRYYSLLYSSLLLLLLYYSLLLLYHPMTCAAPSIEVLGVTSGLAPTRCPWLRLNVPIKFSGCLTDFLSPHLSTMVLAPTAVWGSPLNG